jgi:hypothetical protein
MKKFIDKIVIAMTSDSNKMHFLTKRNEFGFHLGYTSLLSLF